MKALDDMRRLSEMNRQRAADTFDAFTLLFQLVTERSHDIRIIAAASVIAEELHGKLVAHANTIEEMITERERELGEKEQV